MSIFSARGRKKTLLDSENLIYIGLVVLLPLMGFTILLISGMSIGDSLIDGSFSVISALTTTGFMTGGMNDWPESIKFLLLMLMLLGGSSLSLSSGLKIQRISLLVRGFFTEMQRSGHPRIVMTIRRGEGVYTDKALESASVVFFYFFIILLVSISFTLLFESDIMDALSLCVTSVSNSGIAFGGYSTAGSIASMNWSLKIVLMISMFLGRFEILLPLYFLSPRTYTFNG